MQPVVGHKARLKEGVQWGGMYAMTITRVFKNGWLELRRTDEKGRGTWTKVRHEDIEPDYCGRPEGYHSTPHRQCILR